MKPHSMLIGFALALAGAPSFAAESPYLTCANQLAQRFVENTRLGITETKITDYGFSTYKMDRFEEAGFFSKEKYKYESSSKGSSQQNFRVVAKNSATSISFNLGARFYQVKRSKFGSGESGTMLECCYSADEIELTDLGSGHKKKFELPYDEKKCSGMDYALANDEEVMWAEQARPNLCSAFGKKAESWKFTHDWTDENEETVPCNSHEEHRGERGCKTTNYTTYRDVYVNTGCKLAGGNLVPDDDTDFWLDDKFKKKK